MPIHAGFAYAVQIRKRVLNDSILLAYHAERINRRLFVPSLPDGPPDVAEIRARRERHEARRLSLPADRGCQSKRGPV